MTTTLLVALYGMDSNNLDSVDNPPLASLLLSSFFFAWLDDDWSDWFCNFCKDQQFIIYWFSTDKKVKLSKK